MLKATDKHKWKNKKRAVENINEYIKRFFSVVALVLQESRAIN
jgi:hypothetical protein